MNYAPSLPLSSIWTAAKKDFSAHLGAHPQGLVALGVLLAYPLHEALVAKYGMVPTACITGDKATGKTLIAEAARALFRVSVQVTQSSTPVAIRRLLCDPDIGLVILDEYRERKQPRSRLMDLAELLRCSSSRRCIVTGSCGARTILHHPLHPPLITGLSTPSDVALQSRLLHFTTDPRELLSHDDMLSLHASRDEYYRLSDCLAGVQQEFSSAVDTAMKSHRTRALLATLAARKNHRYEREALLLAMAVSIFECAEAVLSGTGSTDYSLTEWAMKSGHHLFIR